MNTKKKVAPKQPKAKRSVVTISSKEIDEVLNGITIYKPVSQDEVVYKVFTALKSGSKIKVVNDISVELNKYDSLPLECDGMTRVLSYVLTQLKVKHAVMIGVLYHQEQKVVPVHWWIVLKDGRIVDYRARMWAGNVPTVPHGVFKASDFKNVKYVGEPNNIEVTKKMFDILTTIIEPKVTPMKLVEKPADSQPVTA